MPEFTQSWAFAFIAGCIVGGIITFIVTIIMVAGNRRSRAEERISDEAIYEATEREKKRWGEPEIEIVTQGNPRTD